MTITYMSTTVEHYPTASDYDGTPIVDRRLDIAPGTVFAERDGHRFTITSFRYTFGANGLCLYGRRMTKGGTLSLRDAFEQYVGAVPVVVTT